MSGGRLPRRIVFGNREGAVRRGRGGKAMSGPIAYRAKSGRWHRGDRKAMALETAVWVETVAEGERRFMATLRKEEVNAARHRQNKREVMRLGMLLSHTEA